MDSNDSTEFTNTRQASGYSMPPTNMNQFSVPSSYTILPQSPNQFSQPSGYTFPPHNLNHFTPSIYPVDPKNGTFPFHIEQHNTNGFSYPELLNAPIVSSQSCETKKTSKKRAKDAHNSNISQNLCLNLHFLKRIGLWKRRLH
ncbi:unnamed protein product [Cuscuta epithymum]|uniref:Uncharacterized protein n=1 Tax=Cuscuta epithymum TaxID=186058 RepID=A0AAV0DM00_9ASTE|nr:unnamed protein product [Cuscuta epithymum]